MSSHINSFNPPDSIDIVLSEDLDGPILAEYTWAIKQIHSSHGEVKKWILYAGQQLEMAGYPKDKISTKLRADIPEIDPGYISEICSPFGWTDSRFSKLGKESKDRQTDPQISSTCADQAQTNNGSNNPAPDSSLAGPQGESGPAGSGHLQENKEYILHLQQKVEFIEDLQKKLRERPFLSLLDREQYSEYTFLADKAEELARQAWDERQAIPVSTQFFLAQMVVHTTIKHGAAEYMEKVKDIYGLTRKQVTKTLRGLVSEVHCIYEPTNKLEALMDGFYGKQCERCKSWRVRWDNGTCHCYRCRYEYPAKAERLALAREQNGGSRSETELEEPEVEGGVDFAKSEFESESDTSGGSDGLSSDYNHK